jgi:hypothetical protein
MKSENEMSSQSLLIAESPAVICLATCASKQDNPTRDSLNSFAMIEKILDNKLSENEEFYEFLIVKGANLELVERFRLFDLSKTGKSRNLKSEAFRLYFELKYPHNCNYYLNVMLQICLDVLEKE